MVKNPHASTGDPGSVPGWGRSPGEGNGKPLQYSCLENPMDRGGWQATVRGVTKELDTTELLSAHTHTHTHIICVSLMTYTPDSEKTSASSLRPPRLPRGPQLRLPLSPAGRERGGAHIPPTALPAPSTRRRCWRPVHEALPRRASPAPPPSTSAVFPKPSQVTEYTR